MAPLPFDKVRLARVAGRAVARYIDFVRRTSRVVTDPADVESFLSEVSPAIVAVWHGQFLMAPEAKPRHVPLAIMLARHGDAELFADSLSRFNTTLIRGAGANGRRKDRGGATALRAAIRTLQSGVSVGMTGDVPPGPARKCGIGIVTLAQMSGRPIVPLATASSRSHVLKTWSRMTINLPYGKLACVFGDPIWVPRDATPEHLEEARQQVEDGLNRATAKAYALAGSDAARTLPPGVDPRTVSWHDSPPAAPRLGLKAYRTLTRGLQPAAPVLLRARQRKGKEDAARLDERVGKASIARPPGTLVWLHAASVGELNAVLPLAEALHVARPDIRCLFTTGTVTSAQIAARRLPQGDIHQYVPLDAPRFVSRFLAHWRPDAAILTESEIWPNMILGCTEYAIPLALVNGRMSARSFKRWQGMKGVAGPLFSRFDIVLAQNEELAERFRGVGARNVKAVGNLKIDAQPPPVDHTALKDLLEALKGRPFWVAASTHAGEERVVAQAHRNAALNCAGLCTIIVPRHPERGVALGDELKAAGFVTALRSTGALPDASTDIYIADTIGELGTFYAATSLAFVGGSLVPRGGQNPIEAVRHGAVVLTGPSRHNFTDEYDVLKRFSALVEIESAEDLAAQLVALLGTPQEVTRLRGAAEAALGTLAGALNRTVIELGSLLPRARELARVPG